MVQGIRGALSRSLAPSVPQVPYGHPVRSQSANTPSVAVHARVIHVLAALLAGEQRDDRIEQRCHKLVHYQSARSSNVPLGSLLT
jgi:hypothetical protein